MSPAPGITLEMAPGVAVGGGPWTPASISGLVGWWDASDAASVISSGSPATVSQWTNKGGAVHAINAIAGSQPETGTTTINGLNTILYGSTKGLQLAAPTIMGGSSAGTAFYVFAATQDPNPHQGAVLEYWGAHGNYDHESYTDGVIYTGWGATVRKTVGDPGMQLTTPRQVTVRSEPGLWSYALDGAVFYTTATNTVGWNTTLSPGYWLGGQPGGVSIGGRVAEVIVYNVALSAADRLTVETYLRAKWGLGWSPAQLPGVVAWFDASDLSTMTVSGSPSKVSQWRTKVGTNHLSQATGSLQAATGVNTVNGLNVISPDGVDDRLVTFSNFGSATTQYSYYHVHAHVNNVPWGAGSPMSGSGPYGGAAVQHRTYQPAGGGSAYDTGPDLGAGTILTGQACMFSGILDATGYHQRVKHNGQDIANNAAAYTPSSFTPGGMEPWSTNGSRFSPTYCCEIVCCTTALTGADKTNLENYLIAKWGVT